MAQAYYDMATLLDAGVPILRSFDILIEGREGTLKRTLSQVRESVSKGSSLSESLDQHRKVFPEMDRMLIQAAETSGSLSDSFKMLSQWHEFVQRITWHVHLGLLYPVFCLHAAAFILPGPASDPRQDRLGGLPAAGAANPFLPVHPGGDRAGDLATSGTEQAP